MEIKATDSGICIGGFSAWGLKEGKYGVALIKADTVCEAAAVYTKSTIKGAHIEVDEGKLKFGLQAVIVNSGNANAYIKDGEKDAEEMCRIAAEQLGLNAKNVGVASTGITGRKIDLEKIRVLASKVESKLSDSKKGSLAAAKAIMTTDVKPKEISFEYNGIKIGGIAKGSGMIAPNMATMLCFLTTNADLEREELQEALDEVVDSSFNMLVVDGDMSPNDTVMLLSNRKCACSLEDFKKLLLHATCEMTRKMAADGEGATKAIEVTVKGAQSREDAKTAAKAIVSSSLVKTAVYGRQPNWGRIITAMSSKIEFDLWKTDVVFESRGKKVVVLEKGVGKKLEDIARILEGKELRIEVDLNDGGCEATAWGCDMTEEYVKINAEYN